MATMHQIKSVLSGINIDEINAQYYYVGIRVQDDAFGMSVGDIADHNSHIWEDGDDTGDELDGICAISINNMRYVKGEYFGNVVVVLGSNDVDCGEDVGEIVMRNAEVLYITDLQKKEGEII